MDTAVLQTLTLVVPYVLAAMAGVLAERAGVIHIALEGLLLVGAFAAAVTALAFGPFAGAVAGALAGVGFASLHGLVSVRLGGNHVVVGLGINLLAAGLTKFGLVALYDSSANSPRIPGDSAGGLDPMWLIAIIAVVAVHLGLRRTRAGLHVSAVGENPEAARSLGISVLWTRIGALAVGGALVGLGGASLSLENRQFTADMAAGRGYIALAAVIVGRWRPIPAAFACVVFAAADALQIELQASIQGAAQFIQMLPYVLTLVLVSGLIGKSRSPAALGRGA